MSLLKLEVLNTEDGDSNASEKLNSLYHTTRRQRTVILIFTSMTNSYLVCFLCRGNSATCKSPPPFATLLSSPESRRLGKASEFTEASNVTQHARTRDRPYNIIIFTGMKPSWISTGNCYRYECQTALNPLWSALTSYRPWDILKSLFYWTS
jgi:hypothetical protein